MERQVPRASSFKILPPAAVEYGQLQPWSARDGIPERTGRRVTLSTLYSLYST
jgi:hypothetical protein